MSLSGTRWHEVYTFLSISCPSEESAAGSVTGGDASDEEPLQELIQIEIGRTEAQKREKNISHGSYNSLSRAEAL